MIKHKKFTAFLLLFILINFSLEIYASDSFEDLDIIPNIKNNSAYKIVKPLEVAIIEQILHDKINREAKLKASDCRHAFSVLYGILYRYVDPCPLKILYHDFNKPEQVSDKDNWNKIFKKELMPFVNCSFRTKFENYSSHNFKYFIESALKNNKILIFGAGNHNQRASFFLENLELTEDEEKKIILVGALDKKQKPSLYSAIPGKRDIQFIWAKGCAFANQKFQDVGTSLAAPRVTGTLCRLKGMHPALTNQEALNIIFLTATKSCFYSTGNQELDNYLYGPYGALNSISAFNFAAEFIAAKEVEKALTSQNFYDVIKGGREEYKPPKTLRDQLNLMAFLEQHHNYTDCDDDEKKVFTVLQKNAQEIDLEFLYSLPQEFFIPNDLNAFTILTINSKNMGLFEDFIKRVFKVDTRTPDGCSILHHAVAFDSLELVKYYTRINPILVNDTLNSEKVSPLCLATLNDIINVSIIQFLLEKGASIYLDDCVVQPFDVILNALLNSEENEQREKIKQAVMLFLNHKDFDLQRISPEGLEELKELKLEEEFPEVYEKLIGKN